MLMIYMIFSFFAEIENNFEGKGSTSGRRSTAQIKEGRIDQVLGEKLTRISQGQDKRKTNLFSNGKCTLLQYIQMGNTCIAWANTSDARNIQNGEAKAKKLKYVKLIQKGAISDVWIVQDSDQIPYILKLTKKEKLLNEKARRLVLNEKKIMQILDSKFVPSLTNTFQDKEKLYLMMEYFPYGNLRQYLRIRKTFTEAQAKFMIISILIALEHLHGKGIVHMDIKPQNILIDQKCYFCLCDFGLSQLIKKRIKSTITGTSGYQAPQMFISDAKKKRSTFLLDYYSVGVVTYEIITGFNKCSRKQFENSRIRANLHSHKVSKECIDFIMRMLEQNCKKRLGANGFDEIWNHRWLNLSKKERKKYMNKGVKSFVDRQELEGISIKSQEMEESENFIDEVYWKMVVNGGDFQKRFREYQMK